MVHLIKSSKCSYTTHLPLKKNLQEKESIVSHTSNFLRRSMFRILLWIFLKKRTLFWVYIPIHICLYKLYTLYRGYCWLFLVFKNRSFSPSFTHWRKIEFEYQNQSTWRKGYWFCSSSPFSASIFFHFAYAKPISLPKLMIMISSWSRGGPEKVTNLTIFWIFHLRRMFGLAFHVFDVENKSLLKKEKIRVSDKHLNNF